MMLMVLVLLALLFIIGLFSTVFTLPSTSKKLKAWFQSLFITSTKSSGPPHVPTRQAMAEKNKVVTRYRSSSSPDKVELRSIFATFDKNKDGFITKQEMRESLKNMGISMSNKEVVETFEKVDSNGDGLIDMDEFCEVLEWVVRGSDGGGGVEGDLKEAFDVFDGDGDGLITVEELGLVLSSLGLKEGKRLESCKEMISKVDVDGDGKVNFDEFKKMMRAGGKLAPIS